ncbi:MAG: VOC family protein [Candidatus Liptonbacteria bacterium]|nr:VOC family protein [Candidatus Liptonbacteria bacterium]
MATLHPFLRFNDKKCREAMEFYKGIFGGKVEYMTLGESPMAKDAPDKSDYIIHSELSSGKITFFGSDMMRDKAVVGDNVGMALNCESEQELNEHFSKLSQGGDVFMKPEKQFWGGMFAMVTDKYGVEWMLNFQMEPPKKSK